MGAGHRRLFALCPLLTRRAPPGTLRWDAATVFDPLPARFPKPAPPLVGWQEYLGHRLEQVSSDRPDGKLTVEPQMFDGLSYPLTAVWAISQLFQRGIVDHRQYLGKGRVLRLFALGVAARAEERVLLESNYFQEICHYLSTPQLELWCIGPEMSADNHMARRPLGPRGESICFRGTCREGIAEALSGGCRRGTGAAGQATDGKPAAAIVIGFNCGFGSGDDALKKSWHGDLKHLLDSGFPCIFTCANDYNDVHGELEVLLRLNARIVMKPAKSPFHALTVAHEDGNRQETWSSANSFVYAVQGTLASS